MTSTSVHVKTLHSILSDEAKTYRQLIVLTERERTALQQDDLTALAATTQDKEALLANLSQLGQMREQTVNHLVKDLSLSGDTPLAEIVVRLDDVSPPIPKELKDRLAGLQQEFVNLMEQLLTLNYGNRSLIQAGLARIEVTYDYLASILASPDGHYTANGSSHTQPQLAAGNVLNWEI